MTERRKTVLETNAEDPSFLMWSRRGPQLAVGTEKGNLLIYRRDSPEEDTHHEKHKANHLWSLER